MQHGEIVGSGPTGRDEKFLTRSGVARLLGRTGSLNARRCAVRRLENVELHPVRKGRTWVFSEEEVHEYLARTQRKRPPERRIIDADTEAAIVLKLDAGESAIDIAREMHLHILDVTRVRDVADVVRAEEKARKSQA